jgi:putative oxidoreductase
VATYQILPLSLINLQAIGLPWVELLTAVALVSGLFTREAALVTVGMNLMFIVAIGITLYRGEEIMCGCFASGEAGHQIDTSLLVRDAGLLLVGVYLTWAGPRALALDLLLHRRREARI